MLGGQSPASCHQKACDLITADLGLSWAPAAERKLDAGQTVAQARCTRLAQTAEQRVDGIGPVAVLCLFLGIVVGAAVEVLPLDRLYAAGNYASMQLKVGAELAGELPYWSGVVGSRQPQYTREQTAKRWVHGWQPLLKWMTKYIDRSRGT